ncbi:helix-turn-helix domain-containing protein, partial [Megamonas funiformis]
MNLDNINENDILKQIQILENSFNDKGFAHKLYSNLKFLEFMILINRAIINDNKNLTIHHKVSYDKTINSVIDYINEHLFTELNIDYLANHFFVSKYYLMRKFKLKTGYSIHQYILNKRLIVAKEKIKSGIALTQICFDCGFKDYSTFSRTFKQIFKQTPREFKKALNEKTDIYKEAKQYE